MTVEFELRTAIDAPADVVYALSLSIDAHVASMSRSGETAIGDRRTGTLGVGEEVMWRARHFGLPFTMTSRIVEADPPHGFVDEQVRGPFKRFRHKHEFSGDDTATVMVDRVSFDAPLGTLGDIAEAAVLRRYLRRLIAERNTYLKRHAESARRA